MAYGETIKVVGDSAYLGAWEIAAAPGTHQDRVLAALCCANRRRAPRALLADVTVAASERCASTIAILAM